MSLTILAQPRTGSSTLFSSLSCHPDIHGLYEPFRNLMTNSHNVKEGPYFKKLKKTSLFQFKNLINEIDKKYNCIKTIDGHLTHAQNMTWVSNTNAKIILLSRNNLLQQSVSICISSQSKIWHWFTINDGIKIHRNFNFEPIDIKMVKDYMHSLSTLKLKTQKRIESKASGRYMSITYEELYNQKVSSEEYLHKIREILKFGEFDPSKIDEEAVKKLVEIGRFNSEDVYRRIPNIMEIEKELGSKQYGFLFDVTA